MPCCAFMHCFNSSRRKNKSHGITFHSVSRRRGATTTYSCGTAECEVRFSARNGVVGPFRRDHNHAPEPWIPNRNQMYQNLKARSADEVLDLHTIYMEEAARYPDAAPYILYQSVVSSMRNWRRAAQPPVPRTLLDYSRALQDHPTHRHLHLATVEAGGASAVILGMAGFREVLRAGNTIIADATFKTVPAGLPAYQVLTIHVVCGDQFYHPIVALMANKRQELYEAVFRRVWELADNPRPTHLVTDYETALQEALRQVTGLPVAGCYFHYTQALIRQARKFHINVSRNSPGARLVRMYGALALLPAERVPAALVVLGQAARALEIPIHDGFHSYFVRQWMTRVTPECFSVYGRQHRTSNVAESYHAFLVRNLGSSPNVWAFTQLLSNKFVTCGARRQGQLAGDRRPARRNRPQQILRLTNISQNNASLAAGIISLQDFITSTSDLIYLRQNIAHDVPDAAEEVEVAERALDEDVDFGEEVEVAEHALDEEVVPLPPPAAPAPPAPAPVAARCGICLDTVPTRVLIPCGHTMCDACLLGIQEAGEGNRDRCPYCRAHIVSCYNIYL